MEQSFDIGGKFTFELVRDGKVIDSWEEKNLVVDEGLNHLLNVELGVTAKEANWYVGIFQGNATPISTWDAAQVASVGQADECVTYTEANRPLWQRDVASSQSITNATTKAEFTMSAGATIYGAFLVSNDTKGGTAGVLFAASRFTNARNVVVDDLLLVTYTVTASNPA